MKPSDLSAQERAYDYIKGRIIRFELRPSDRLRAQDLAARLGLSRTPVREALSRLEQEGLVRKEGGWGYVVRPMSTAEVLNLYKVREALEVEAALEALPRVNEGFLAYLSASLEEARGLLKTDQTWEFLGANRRFHTAISDLTENTILQTMLGMISDRIQIVGALVVRNHSDRKTEILAENQAILEAFRANDISKTEAAVRSHVRGARNSVIRFLSESLNHLLESTAK